MATQLAPSDIELLEVESISSSVGSTFYGIYCVLALLSVYTISSQTKGGFTNGRRFLVIVIITMFIFDTMNSIVSVYLVAEDIRTSFGAIPYPRATVALILVDLVMSKLNFFLSDLVIIWRAWSVYEPRPHSVRILLILCVFISFGSVFVDIVLAFKTTLSGLEKKLSYATAKIILPLGLFLTNVIATSLIALKTWRFRNALKEAGADGQGSVRHLVQVLMRLVESGCIYSLLWVVVLLDITQGFSPEVRYMFTNIIPHLAGIYPCLIVLLICYKKQTYDHMGNFSRTSWSTNPFLTSGMT